MSVVKIWFALVRVKPLKGNEFLPDSKGAYVNVAYACDNEVNLKSELAEVFKYHKFKVTEINDIETVDTLIVDNPSNAEKVKLLNEINEGFKFAWGTFHAF